MIGRSVVRKFCREVEDIGHNKDGSVSEDVGRLVLVLPNISHSFNLCLGHC